VGFVQPLSLQNPNATSPRVTLLYYSEFASSVVGLDDSFVEGAVRKQLKEFFRTIVVYYDKSVDKTREASHDTIVVPYRRRSRLIEEVSAFVDPGSIDFLIVRNTVAALRNALRHRSRYGYKVGFHPTFPHALRRVHEANLAGHARLRKRIEYHFNTFRLNREAKRCDFVISSSDEMIADPSIRRNMRFFRLDNGVDVGILPSGAQQVGDRTGPIRFVYIGNFDIARQLDVVFRAFDELESDNWRIDVFTADGRRANEIIARSMKRISGRVRILPAIDRAALFRELPQYDVGLCLIPVVPLYLVSSPLKMIEYYACGIPSIMTPLPACLEAFGGRGCAFFADFNIDSIRQTIEKVLSTDRAQLRRMGATGRQFVIAERNYGKIARDLAEFLFTIQNVPQQPRSY
jgi:glycosyltransferase involved in cell wall biosynthesis